MVTAQMVKELRERTGAPMMDCKTALAESQGDSFFGGFTELLALMRSDVNTYTPERDQKEGLYTIPAATTGGRRNGPREYILETIAQGHPLHLRYCPGTTGSSAHCESGEHIS